MMQLMYKLLTAIETVIYRNLHSFPRDDALGSILDTLRRGEMQHSASHHIKSFLLGNLRFKKTTSHYGDAF